jgi:hypothetical protein
MDIKVNALPGSAEGSASLSEGASNLTQTFVLFSYFQLLDLLTTIGFLIHGVAEANPVVKFALQTAPTPMSGLLAVKVAAILLGVYCWRLGREKLLGRINVLFGALISWNLVALIVHSVMAR